MYGSNLIAFLKLLIREGAVNLNRDDEIIRETLVTHGNDIVHARVNELATVSR